MTIISAPSVSFSILEERHERDRDGPWGHGHPFLCSQRGSKGGDKPGDKEKALTV